MDTNTAPVAGLLVRPYDGETDLGLLEQTDENGRVTFTLPAGSYRFRADRNGTPFWSGAENHCTVPECGAAGVTVTVPVTIRAVGFNNTALAGLPVFAYDGETYAGFSRTANENGEALFVLPEGSYRFRTEFDGQEFWSGETNHCTIPGCLDAMIELSVGGSGETLVTTIDYTYDALHRLTAADYDSGAFFHYVYDEVGNRLNETTDLGETDYIYDAANRLIEAGGRAVHVG